MKDLTYLTLIVIASLSCFQIGQWWKMHQIRPTIIENQGAHYDMTTGDFVWGKAPTVYDPEMMANQLSDALKPAKKVSK